MNAKEFELKIENAIKSKTNKEKNIVSEMEQVKDLIEEKGIFYNFQNATKSLIYYLFLLNSKLSVKNRISLLETYFSQPFFMKNMNQNFLTDWIANQYNFKKQEKIKIKSYTEDDEEFSSLITPFTKNGTDGYLKFMLTNFNKYGIASTNTNNLLFLYKPNDKLDEDGENRCISKYCNKYKLNNRNTYQRDFDSEQFVKWKELYPKKQDTKQFEINVFELLNYISIIEKIGLCYINREQENFIITFKNGEDKFSFNIFLLKDILTTLLKLGIEKSKVYYVATNRGFQFTDAKIDADEFIEQNTLTLMPTILSSGVAIDFHFDLDKNSIFYDDKYFGYAFQLKVNNSNIDNVEIENFIEEKPIKIVQNSKSKVEEFNNDLDYLKNLLSISNDLLDLISETGDKEDIDFLNEKIKVTQDLISILDDNYAFGGQISTSSPYAIENADNWNQIPSTWKNTTIINKVNYERNPLDKKFQSVFNFLLGEDELRPVFSGYNVDDYGITVTDAHRLAHIPAKLSNKGVFDPKTGGLIEFKYPNYENIIPNEFSSINELDTYKLLQYCRVADKYCNQYSHQVAFKYKESSTDSKYKYIGFNVDFLIGILESALKNGFQKIYFNIARKNQIAIISNVEIPKLGKDLFFLLMPVMLRDINGDIASQDLDFNLSLSCFFDFYKNNIINKDGSIADFKMDYGINPIFTDEVIKIIKSSLQKNPSLPILENIKVQDGSVFLMNLKGYSYSVTIPNINVPNGLYYIKDNVAVKNENADVDDFVGNFDYDRLNKINSFKINKNYLTHLINIAKLYIGDDELRPTMTGINFKYDGVDMYVNSTNAHYLSKIKVIENIDYENNSEFSIILPVNNIITLLDSNEDEFITIDIFKPTNYADATPSNIKIDSSSYILEQRLIDGKYPNINAVIPYTNKFELNLNKKDILNAIKSKEAEAFLKRNKKFNIVISAKKNNDMLSINLYSTSDSRYETNKEEEIEILKTDYRFVEKEVITTNSCLLLMPMVSEENIFAFNLKLFKEFIYPVNTENFNISFNERQKAFIINEEFFEYKESFKKPTKPSKFVEQKPLITKIERKQEIPVKTNNKNFESSLPEWLKKEFLELSDDGELQSDYGLFDKQDAMYQKMITDEELFIQLLKNWKNDYESDMKMEESSGNDYTYLLSNYHDIIKLLKKYENKNSENISPKKETPAESKSDLEYLNELLVVSQDLLDLISETGDKEDIDFLNEKIKVTKDLISLM